MSRYPHLFFLVTYTYIHIYIPTHMHISPWTYILFFGSIYLHTLVPSSTSFCLFLCLCVSLSEIWHFLLELITVAYATSHSHYICVHESVPQKLSKVWPIYQSSTSAIYMALLMTWRKEQKGMSQKMAWQKQNVLTQFLLSYMAYSETLTLKMLSI